MAFCDSGFIELDLTPEDIIQEYKRKNDINRAEAEGRILDFANPLKD